jgi:zinc transport system substrate-binding protein
MCGRANLLKCVVLLGMALFGLPASAATPKVVVSIKPLHSLAIGVMDGIATPDVLIKGSASVHAYALKPSEAAALRRADIVFWIGPEFEAFLEKSVAGKKGTRALGDIPGLKRLSARSGGVWEGQTDPHDSDPHDAAHHDGHVWLDPANAKVIVAAMAEALAAADTDNAARYRANAAAVTARIDALDADLKAQLAPVQSKPYVVFHDAYQYFERHYGLRAVGSVTVSADRAPGARRVLEIKKKLSDLGAACIFTEPQFAPTLVNALAQDDKIATGVLDPEGSTLAPGADLYTTLMRNLAANLIACLNQS